MCAPIYLVDGGWGEFGDWEDCPVSCGGGQHSRIRMCDNPAPQFGGLDCTNDGSSDTETEDCNTQECPSRLNIPLLTIAPKDLSKML